MSIPQIIFYRVFFFWLFSDFLSLHSWHSFLRKIAILFANKSRQTSELSTFEILSHGLLYSSPWLSCLNLRRRHWCEVRLEAKWMVADIFWAVVFTLRVMCISAATHTGSWSLNRVVFPWVYRTGSSQFRELPNIHSRKWHSESFQLTVTCQLAIRSLYKPQREGRRISITLQMDMEISINPAMFRINWVPKFDPHQILKIWGIWCHNDVIEFPWEFLPDLFLLMQMLMSFSYSHFPAIQMIQYTILFVLIPNLLH